MTATLAREAASAAPRRQRRPSSVLGKLAAAIAFLWLHLAVASAQDGTPRWAGPFTTGGYIVSSPATAPDGTIYFGAQDNYLYALNANGTLKWRFLTGDWVDSSPAIGADGTIYFGSWDGKFYALAPDGAKKWEFSTGVGNYIYSSPALGADGTIYFGAGDANFYALRPDGTLKWTFPAADWIDSSPAIGANGQIYYGSWDGNVYALRDEGAGARELWRFATGGPVLTSPALGRDGTIYIGANDGRLYALDGESGAKRWDFLAGGTLESSPAVGPDGTIYFGGSTGYLHALAADGALKWKFSTIDPVASTPAVRGDGTIIVGSGDSKIYALDARGALQWKINAGDWVDASPLVAADGSIYVGSYDRKLYAFHGSGSPASAFSNWPMFRRDLQHGARTTALPSGGRLVNLSTRAEVGGANGMIAGFVVAGASEKNFLVRAIGPTLAQFGVAAPLADPALVLRAERTTVVENDNWPALLAPRFAAVGAFPLPSGSRDAALVHLAPTGPYTAQVTPSPAEPASASGVALVEIYDADANNPATRLLNLSARAFVGTGDRALTPGFVIGGMAPLRVLVRGVGPSLIPLGVTNVLARPSLTLFSGDTPIASNTGWTTTGTAADLSGAAQTVGAFPLVDHSTDSALLVTLAPGAYTVRLAGVNDTTGEALVEIYLVP